jgi:hypothetical protein
MKSFTRFLLLTVAILTTTFGLEAQVSLYTMTPLSGTFTPLSGATATSLSATADDGLSTAFPIGFDFTYDGVIYTSLRASSNGLLTFNATGTSTTTNNLATTTTSARPGVAPLWDDLQCTVGVKYQLSGTAPNRVLTVEWLNMEWNYGANVPVISFQVKLFETSNIIDFIYRSETASGNPGGSSGASIGLMGTTPTDFLSLQNSSAFPSTSVTTSTNNIASKPATGQIYRFAIQSLAPTLSAVTISPSICAPTSRVVTASAQSTSGTITSVVLNYSFNGVPQSPITMTNTSGSNYTATIPTATPVNAVISWNILALNSNGVGASHIGVPYQEQPWLGVTANAVASPSTVCAGGTSNLTAVTTNTSVEVLGTSAPYFSSTTYSGVFYHFYGGVKTQHVYLASELLAAGLAAGPINSFSMLMSTPSGFTYNGLSISMGQTSQSALAGFDNATSMTSVYSAASYTSATGLNNFGFAAPFVWDGVSNIIVQFCWSNNNGGVSANSTSVYVVSPGFTCTAYYRGNNETPSQICGQTNAYLTNSTRPVLYFFGNKKLPASSFQWYQVGNTNSVGALNPQSVIVSSTSDYYAIANIDGCLLNTSTATVTTLALPATPIATNSTQCGTAIPTASVASAAGAAGTGDFYWYDAATSGNLVQNSSWLTQINENFNGATVAANGVLSGNASLTATPGWMQLTTNQNSQQGGFTVQPGVNGIQYKIDFDFKTNTTGGADGFSWSFAPDADATIIGDATTLPAAEMGTGSKLKISFDSYGTTGDNIKGTYLLYNNTGATFNSASAGVLASTTSTPWLSTTSKHVTITISQTGILNMTVDGIPVFNNIALPASYLAENKSTWKHVFAARTGGVNMKNEIDNLVIQYKLSPVGSTTFNSPLSSGVTYYVTELGANGCYSPLAPVVIGVSQPAAVTYNNSASAICIGESITLNMSANITPAYTYTITSPNAGAGVGSAATGASQTFTPTASGNIPYIVTAANGNCTDIDTVIIAVVPGASPAPIIAVDTLNICPSATSALFTATSSAMNIPYTFNLIDSYGDGWNGNALKVLANGVLIQTLTFTTGSSFTAVVNIPEGSAVTTQWTTGSFLSECSFNIVLNGATIHTATGLTTANLATKMYSGTAPSYNYTFTWYSAPTGGTLLGTGASLEALGTSVLPNLNTVGQYIVYAKQSNACLSAATPAVVNVTNVLAQINPVAATCNSVANGTFTLGTITCGTTPFTYSVDGGSFGNIPTNLAYGSHTVVVKDATGAVAPAATIFIDQPTWITNVPNFVSNGWACKDETSEIISAANPNLQQTQTIALGTTVNVAPTTSVTLNPALNLPVGAVVTGATLQINGLTTSGGTWANDLTVVVSGLGTLNQIPSGTTVTNANYSYPLSGISANGTAINVVITNTWTSGSAVINNVSLVVSYTINQTLNTITWYATPTGGTSLGSGFTLQTVGTSVLPNTSIPGTYNFYAQGELNGCSSFTRQLVPVTIQAPTIVANMQTAIVCPGDFLTLSATGGLSYSWSNGAGQNTPFIPAPTAYVAGTQSYVVNGFDVDGCANQDTVIVTVKPQPIFNAGFDQSVCAGTPVILNGSTTQQTATAVTSILWSNGITNNTQFVPTASGVLTATATGANGCTTQDQVTITVLALPSVNAGIDQTICAGTGVTLTATGAASYSWNNGINQGITFYPTVSQIYTVTGIGANGCVNQDQVQVNISNGPAVTVSAPQTVCANTSAAFSAFPQNALGGYWSTNGSGTILPNTSSAAINYIPSVNDPQVVTLTYVATNACGNASNATTVNVLTLPTLNAGVDQAVCEGSSVVLNAASNGSVTWLASNVNNGVAFVPAATATYTAVATGANNCTIQDQLVVTVLPLPDVSAGADITICSGTDVILVGAGAVDYSWNNGVSNGVSFTPNATSIYTVTGTAANGCSSSDQVLVTVNSTPQAVATILNSNTLEATPAGMNYQWINCTSGTDVPNASFVTFNALENGTYAVIVTSLEGCSDQSDCITLDAVGVDQIADIVMSVQPNPTSGDLNISMPSDLTASAQVFDAQGKLVIDQTNVSNGSVLNLMNMTTGVYMIRITAADSVQTFRVVKQ